MSKLPDDSLFILGAGADRYMGLPLMNGLRKELSEFSKGDGKPLHNALRSKTPGIRFTLDKVAADTGEDLAAVLLGAEAGLIESLRRALTKDGTTTDKMVLAIDKVLGQLATIRGANEIDESYLEYLATYAGEEIESASAFVLQPGKTGFGSTARQAFRRVCQDAINEGTISDQTLRYSVQAMLDAISTFEDLLGSLFLGFFNNNKQEQKKYFYLVWLFWAYIKHCEANPTGNYDDSIYPVLQEIGARDLITFNYTSFANRIMDCAPLYFHGDGETFIDFETRSLFAASSVLSGNSILPTLTRYITNLNINFSSKVSQVVLPGVIPPLVMKPIIASEYVDLWFDCSQKIRSAKTIVVIGYSFAFADEHFNDLLRKGAGQTRIVAVGPDMATLAQDVCRVMGRDRNELKAAVHDGLICTESNLTCIVEARAEELSSAALETLCTLY